MEKVTSVICLLWRSDNCSDLKQFHQHIDSISQALCDDNHLNSSILSIRALYPDDAVLPAQPLRIDALSPQVDAVLMLDTTASALQNVIQRFDSATTNYACYNVSTTIPIPYRHDQPLPSRIEGMNQFVCLRRPDSLDEKDWLHNWQVLHTPVAINTQSTFCYRQHRVMDLLVSNLLDHPKIDAFVEENFPSDAMDNRQKFFAAKDDAEMQQRSETMINSCMRFIDITALDCIPCSEWVYR